MDEQEAVRLISLYGYAVYELANGHFAVADPQDGPEGYYLEMETVEELYHEITTNGPLAGVLSPNRTGRLTPEDVGNQQGLMCPSCNQGDDLRIAATVVSRLTWDGADTSYGDVEWDDDSYACCAHCDWQGTVKDLKQAENFEE